MFKAMDGMPVIVRLLDPPLHEFLESPRALDVEIARMEATGADPRAVNQKRDLMEKIDSFAEQNPMLGLRGCRLGIVYPILPVMQIRAIATATARLKKEGLDPKPEIMIPLVSVVAELEKLRGVAEKTIAEVAEAEGVELEIPIGTMIELPRAAVTADEIAARADFFSFGTNDLTQTTFGFSRDDVEAEFVLQYLTEHLLPHNPFATIDAGVAKLVKMGVQLGHEGNPDLVCGVCGEHGGDPDSIHTFNEIGLDYVSCSPLSRARGAACSGSGGARCEIALRFKSYRVRRLLLWAPCIARGLFFAFSHVDGASRARRLVVAAALSHVRDCRCGKITHALTCKLRRVPWLCRSISTVFPAPFRSRARNARMQARRPFGSIFSIKASCLTRSLTFISPIGGKSSTPSRP